MAEDKAGFGINRMFITFFERGGEVVEKVS